MGHYEERSQPPRRGRAHRPARRAEPHADARDARLARLRFKGLCGRSTGYLNKDAAFDELSAAIDEVCAGRRYLCRAIDADLVEQHAQHASNRLSALEALTPRPREILQLVAEGRSTRQIAERLFLSVKTVETHLAQLKQRLGIFDVPGPVRFAMRSGLLPPEAT